MNDQKKPVKSKRLEDNSYILIINYILEKKFSRFYIQQNPYQKD